MSTQPTDAEIDEFLDSPGNINWVLADKRERFRLFARAVLARWGQPAHSGEPVAWLNPWRADQVTTDYDAYGEHGIPLVRQHPQPSPAAQGDALDAEGREQERTAFKDAHRHLDLDEVPDAWGRPMFKHSHVEASWLGWIARASHGQASSQAGEYPALVCDYCGALTPDPWHSSGMLHGKMSKHIHSCDACAARGAAHGITGGQHGAE